MSEQRLSDSQWIRNAVVEYEGPLTLYVSRMLGDVERARDVVQDAFMKLCMADREKVEDHLVEWLYTVCRNRALDVRRKESRLNRLSDEAVRFTDAGVDRPDDIVSTQDEAGKMMRLMAELTENQQEVLRLKFQHGMSYKQISEITGLSVTNVGFIIHTGIKKLRDKMEGESTGTATTADKERDRS